MKKKIHLLFFLLLNMLLFSCANIGTLGGGKEDTEAPKLITSNLSETNFNSRKIILEFNEYIITSNPEKNILLQPGHTTMKFSAQGKKIIISLDSSLHPNTTYNLIINKGIIDNNANNGFVYSKTFSTGAFIDSSSINIRINDYNLYKGLKIALSNNNGTDSFKNFKTDYLFDESENIIFNGLKASSVYNLWLFTDLNNDQKPDIYQPINFIKNVQADSSYTIQAFPWNEPFRIKSVKTDTRTVKLLYTRPSDAEKEIVKTTGLNRLIYVTTDSALMFLDTTINFQLKADTIPLIDYKKEVYDLVRNSIRIIKMKNEYQISHILPSFYTSDNHPGKDQLFKTKKLDSILLYKQNNKNTIPDTFYLNKINISDYKTLSFLKLDIKNQFSNTFDILIIKDNKTILKARDSKGFDTFLEPGMYKVQVYENGNNKLFNPFSMSAYPQKLYEKEIVLKANWEEVLEIIIK
jgi:hypothetical protein